MSAPPGFYAGSGTTADPYYAYYVPNPYTGKMLELDRADAIRYMSGETDQYGNPIDERPIDFDDYLDTGSPSSTGVDPNNPNPPPPTGAAPSTGAPPPTATDADFAVPIADAWADEYGQSAIDAFFARRGGMGADNPYYRRLERTEGGLNTLWSLMDYSWEGPDSTDTAAFRNFVDDLFSAGGNVDWNLGTFRTVIQNMLTGNLPQAMLEVMAVMDSPSEAMSFLNELFQVFGPLMGERRQRMFGTLLRNIWKDMSDAYAAGTSVQTAFTDALTRIARVFGLGS
jgi:hypothetical protein